MSSKMTDYIVVENLPTDIIEGKTYAIAQSNPNSYTHSFFKYPCRFIPEIPRWGIKKFLSNTENRNVFDPFAGSGTTLLESIINGHNAFGTEIDNIARLIIKVKTTALDEKAIYEIQEGYESIVNGLDLNKIPEKLPGINNLEHWFTKDSIIKLSSLKENIDEITNENIRDFFNVVFVSIIKRVSNADDISPKPYVSRKIIKNPPDAIDEFKRVYKIYYEKMIEQEKLNIKNKAKLIKGDAIEFEFQDGFDLAITSPPYINAFDYARTMRLENLWLDTVTETELRDKKREYVGTESIKVIHEEQNLGILEKSELLKEYFEKVSLVDKRRGLIIKRFFEDMEENLKNVYDSLNPGGRYMIVIGNSNIRKVEIESWRILLDLAEQIGFSKDVYFNYVIQNPYIRIPRGNRGGKINLDHVLVLKKEE